MRVVKKMANVGGKRRISKTTQDTLQNLGTPGQRGRNEIDSLADTSCAGINWIPLYFTGDTVNVHGYNGMEQDTSIPVATCATKVITEAGTFYILVMPQMLWFGNTLQRSLINPNQLRMHGTLVKDDPTIDGEQEFGMTTDNLFVPFETAGSTVYFHSFAPTYEEVEECRIQVIGPQEWDPFTVRLRDDMVKSDKAVEIAALRTHYRVPFSALSMNRLPVELVEEPNEPSMVLSSVSTTLDSKAFDRELLSKLVTTERHSPITAEEVAKKFAVGLETAKKTIQVTTQRGIRHAVHPIHRRCRTDHLDLNRKRLGGTWFMDTLVARHQSSSGNRYMHVITNG